MLQAIRRFAMTVLRSDRYGMLIVLLFLVAVFSVLTLKTSRPAGRDAGRVVVRKIAAAHGPNAGIVVVVGKSAQDAEFVAGVREELELRNGRAPLSVVQGEPADARRALEQLLSDGKSIDALAATERTATWTVFDRFPEVGRGRCVVPEESTWPVFLRLSNLVNIANQTAVFAILAVGMTLVIIAGGIDLSVGALVALSSVSAAVLLRSSAGVSPGPIQVALACVVGIAVCGLAGAVNGVTSTVFRVPAFIVTLSMMRMANGTARRITDGDSISDLPASFLEIGGGTLMGLPNPVIVMIVLYLVAHCVMTRTVFARYVYAIGGNIEAARLSGVPVRRVQITVYTLCGALAGLGGILLTSRLGAGSPKYGMMYELEVITAVVVGGTSLMGGEGRIMGTLVGAFIIAVIKNGMNLTNIGGFNQEIVLGAVLLATVLLDMLKRRTP